MKLTTLTIYPKEQWVAQKLTFGLSTLEHNGIILCYIHRDEADHHLFHQDMFSIHNSHYHAQLSQEIDEPFLNTVLSRFVTVGVLSSAEKDQFLNAYALANSIPNEEAQVLKSFGKIELSDEKAFFESQLNLLKYQADQLQQKAKRNPNYTGEAEEASWLHQTLVDAFERYAHDKTDSNYEAFQETCQLAIEKAKPVLAKRESIQAILGSLLFSLALIGFGFLMASGIGVAIAGAGIIAAGITNKVTTDRFLFFSDYEMSNNLDSLSSSALAVSPG